MLILLLQAALSAAALFQLYRTRMLPVYYLAILGALLVLLWLLVFKCQRYKVRGVLARLFSLLLSAGMGGGLRLGPAGPGRPGQGHPGRGGDRLRGPGHHHRALCGLPQRGGQPGRADRGRPQRREHPGGGQPGDQAGGPGQHPPRLLCGPGRHRQQGQADPRRPVRGWRRRWRPWAACTASRWTNTSASNFAGFIDVVDALDGIDVYSDYAFTSVGSPGYYDPHRFCGRVEPPGRQGGAGLCPRAPRLCHRRHPAGHQPDEGDRRHAGKDQEPGPADQLHAACWPPWPTTLSPASARGRSRRWCGCSCPTLPPGTSRTTA